MTEASAMAMLAGLVLGYVLGAIPFGLLLTRAAGLGDIRAIGSGNIGATNVLRTGNKGLAAATLLLDALKGTAAVLLAARFLGADAALAAALGAFLGHIAPVWLRFRGGKGVATFIGVLLALAPAAVLVFAAVWLATAFATRYSSLSALAASVATVVAVGFMRGGPLAVVTLALVALLWIKHAPNIRRLREGTEGRIGGKGGA